MIHLDDYPGLIWLAPLTFTRLLLVKLLYIIADSEGGLMLLGFFTFSFMANHFQLSVTNAGCRGLLTKEANGYSFASYC